MRIQGWFHSWQQNFSRSKIRGSYQWHSFGSNDHLLEAYKIKARINFELQYNNHKNWILGGQETSPPPMNPESPQQPSSCPCRRSLIFIKAGTVADVDVRVCALKAHATCNESLVAVLYPHMNQVWSFATAQSSIAFCGWVRTLRCNEAD